ncbi:MAG: desulfoferrodoxin [Bacilli bacterium]|nr:desulfoferrodoxin [Bacilli bacterium]
MKEFIIKKCNKCGAIVKVIEDCNCDNCGIVCCGENMVALKANSTDGAVEKHVPTYEINGDEITIRVNHVMEDDHYIEWISAATGDYEVIKYFAPGEEPKLVCKCAEGMVLYAYCNKHGLWKAEVK